MCNVIDGVIFVGTIDSKN